MLQNQTKSTMGVGLGEKPETGHADWTRALTEDWKDDWLRDWTLDREWMHGWLDKRDKTHNGHNNKLSDRN